MQAIMFFPFESDAAVNRQIACNSPVALLAHCHGFRMLRREIRANAGFYF